MHARRWMITGMVVLMGLVGCRSAYYNAMEKFGYHKRDILVSRVEQARDAQEDTKEQFQSALERFQSVVRVDGGELESQYKKLNSELQRSEDKAGQVRQHIADVEQVAADLFTEWGKELDAYSNASLRRTSEQKLSETQLRYDRLILAMKRAEAKIEPVLAAFRDQVLFLKHNLNAQAIAAIQHEVRTVENEIAALIREMETSITAADAFIQAMGT